MVTYGYVRVSSDGQARDGTSLQSQESKLRAYAVASSLTGFVLVSDEALTTRVPFPERAAGSWLLSRLAPGDHVLVASLDRAWRSVQDCLSTVDAIRERGATLHLLDMPVPDLMSPMGRFTLTVFAALAELERHRIAERTALGREQARLAGKWTQQAPFGFRHVDGRLRPVPRLVALGGAILAMTAARVPYPERLAWVQARFATPREGLPFTYTRLRKLSDRVQRPADRARIQAALASLDLTVSWHGLPTGALVRRRSTHEIVPLESLSEGPA